MSLGLAAVCALGFASSAMAHSFTASRLPKPLSEAEPGKTHGLGIEGEITGEHNQVFRFGAFEIYCGAKGYANTPAEGAVTWATSQTLSTEIKFTKCLTKAHFSSVVAGLRTAFNVNPETKKSEPLKFVYHVNGFAEFGSGETESEVEVGGGAAAFSIAGKVCKISWPAQTVPVKAIKHPEEEFSSAVYSNKFVPTGPHSAKQFPSGEQERLVIANNFKSMKWSYEEGQCLGEGGFEEEAKTTEGKGATYEGTLEEWVQGGNLGFE
jgi:hypothetical protein